MHEPADELNIANWEDAIRDGFDTTYNMYRDVVTDAIYVARPDGSIVWVAYYPRGQRYRARRVRANGKLGASKYYNAEDSGWLKALNHRLPSAYRSF